MNDTITINGEQYDASTYHKTSRSTGTQQWVAYQWAKGAIPVNSRNGGTTLTTSTGNFVGIHYPEGHGKLKHYAHMECIRTKSGLIISDTSCYARGFAKCDTPTGEVDYRFDVTTLQANLKGESETIYEIVSVDGDVVKFQSSRKYNLDTNEWTNPADKYSSPNALGV